MYSVFKVEDNWLKNRLTLSCAKSLPINCIGRKNEPN